MHVEGIDTGMAHPALHPACPHIAGILRPHATGLIPMLPRIAEMATQHQLVELRWSIVTEDGVLQSLGTILLLEHQTEGVLGVLIRQPTLTAVHPHATRHAEVMLLRTAEELYATGTCPSVPCCIASGSTCENINTTSGLIILMTEEIFFIGNERQDGQGMKALDDFSPQRGIARHLQVHLVVGSGRARENGIFSPCRGIALRSVRLAEYRRCKEIAGRCDRRDNLPTLHFDSPQERSCRKREGSRVKHALSCGSAAVCGIMYFRRSILGYDSHNKRSLIVKSMRPTELRLRDNRRQQTEL